jgi:hypothetical protein
MKKFLFVFSFLVVFQSKAQNSFPFPDTNAYWNMFYQVWGNLSVDNPIGVIGDTTINNTQYVKICQSTDTLFEFQSNYPFYCAVREEDSKYYFVFPDETSEVLVYDFTLAIGDTISYTFSQFNGLSLIVIEKDSILVGSNYRKRLKFINADPQFSNWDTQEWIEGIGSNFGLKNIREYYYDGGHYTSCFHQNDSLVYLNPQFQACYRWTLVGLEENKIQPLKVFPNPANEQISFELLSDELLQSPFEITDMQGKNYFSSTVNSSTFSISTIHFPSGVYFYKILHSSGKVYRGKFVKKN